LSTFGFPYIVLTYSLYFPPLEVTGKSERELFHHSGCSQVNQFISWISAQVMQTIYFFEFLVRLISGENCTEVFLLSREFGVRKKHTHTSRNRGWMS